MQHLENSAWHAGCQPPTLIAAQGIVTLPTSFSGGQGHSAPRQEGHTGLLSTASQPGWQPHWQGLVASGCHTPLCSQLWSRSGSS